MVSLTRAHVPLVAGQVAPRAGVVSIVGGTVSPLGGVVALIADPVALARGTVPRLPGLVASGGGDVAIMRGDVSPLAGSKRNADLRAVTRGPHRDLKTGGRNDRAHGDLRGDVFGIVLDPSEQRRSPRVLPREARGSTTRGCR